MHISIIITTYNAAAYVRQTLDSICKQTYPHFEIIVVDDGSKDSTLKVIEDYLKTVPNFKIQIFSVNHIGRAKALRLGVEKAIYDWVAILDADDIWHEAKLAKQVEIITNNHIQFLATNAKLFYKDSDIDTKVVFKLDLASKLKPISLDSMLYTNRISHSSVLMKKALADYNSERKTQIDYELFLRLLDKGVALFLLDETLTYHRIHPGQSFEAKKPFRYALNATLLQLKYCIKHSKWRQALFVLIKLGYYGFLPRKMRFMLSEAYQARR